MNVLNFCYDYELIFSLKVYLSMSDAIQQAGQNNKMLSLIPISLLYASIMDLFMYAKFIALRFI